MRLYRTPAARQRAAGLDVSLGDSNNLRVMPATLLTPELRTLIRDHKHDLVLALEARDSDPDRWCWPNSTAITGREIETFMVRLIRFSSKGQDLDGAERLANRLVIRDREADGRRVCLECKHLSGSRSGSWRCGNWQSAGIAIRARDNQLPRDLVFELQRCDGLAHQFNPQKAHHD